MKVKSKRKSPSIDIFMKFLERPFTSTNYQKRLFVVSNKKNYLLVYLFSTQMYKSLVHIILLCFDIPYSLFLFKILNCTFTILLPEFIKHLARNTVIQLSQIPLEVRKQTFNT